VGFHSHRHITRSGREEKFIESRIVRIAINEATEFYVCFTADEIDPEEAARILQLVREIRYGKVVDNGPLTAIIGAVFHKLAD
jgi:hypothetical protein